MINEKNSTYLFVGNVTKGSATTVDTLPNDSVAIVDAATNAVKTSALSASDYVKVVKKTSVGTLIYSPAFSLANITSKTKNEENSFDVQQVSYLGATSDSAVTGIGTVTVGNAYVVNLAIRNAPEFGAVPFIKFGTYKATTTSQFDLVTGIKESLDRQLKTTFANNVILVDRVSDGTRTAFSAGTGDATSIKVYNGSKGVSYVKAGDAAATVQTALTVGTYIKIKNILYKVASATTSGFVLDQPYNGVSETIAFTDTNTGSYNATNFGLKFSGVRQSFNSQTETSEYQLVYFDILSEDLTVSEYKAVYPAEKQSDGARVAYLEKYSQYLNKQPVVSSYPVLTATVSADVNTTYKLYTVNITNEIVPNPVVGSYSPSSTIIIAIKGTLSEGIDTVLSL